MNKEINVEYSNGRIVWPFTDRMVEVKTEMNKFYFGGMDMLGCRNFYNSLIRPISFDEYFGGFDNFLLHIRRDGCGFIEGYSYGFGEIFMAYVTLFNFADIMLLDIKELEHRFRKFYDSIRVEILNGGVYINLELLLDTMKFDIAEILFGNNNFNISRFNQFPFYAFMDKLIDAEYALFNKNMLELVVKVPLVTLTDTDTVVCMKLVTPCYLKEFLDTILASKFCKYYTYIMWDDASKYYKIGRSGDLVYREKTLAAQNPKVRYDLILRYDMENLLHKTFADLRVRGEWFNLQKQQNNILKSIFKFRDYASVKEKVEKHKIK